MDLSDVKLQCNYCGYLFDLNSYKFSEMLKQMDDSDDYLFCPKCNSEHIRKIRKINSYAGDV